jgi:DNA-binding CsgD family transcriptional regulator
VEPNTGADELPQRPGPGGATPDEGAPGRSRPGAAAPDEGSPGRSGPERAVPDERSTTLVSARRVERLMVRVRYVMGLVVAAMAVLFDPASLVAAFAVAALLLGANVAAHLRLEAVQTPRQQLAFVAGMVAVDAVAALATYGLFLGDPTAMPVALMAFLVFALAVRFGRWGAVVGLVGFAVALGARVEVQRSVLAEGAVRVELVLLWCAVALLLAVVAQELRAQEGRWRTAFVARERVAQDLQATVAQTLAYAGIDPGAATHGEVLDAVHELVDSSHVERDALIDRVAAVLAVPHHGLSPREQEILLLLARGDSDARIARTLFISPSTVRNHLHNMRNKLGLSSREELSEFAMRYAPPG